MNAAIAPELSTTLTWLQGGPVRLGECRGGAVALVFWSAGSPFCHNVLDRLRDIQARFPARLRVIAVHVPKFEAERIAEVAARAVSRLRIAFPVAHDPDFVAWQHFGIRAWPSVVLIDRDGQVRQILAGDDGSERLLAGVQALVEDVDRDLAPVQVKPALPAPEGVLAFPAGLAVSDSRLYIADQGRHRVLECSHEGRVIRVFGSGHPDQVDGAHDEAAFNRPQGLTIVGNRLYIADTGNHALRSIGLHDGSVNTLAGNGKPGAPREGDIADPRSVSLDAPWDVEGGGEKVYIAMAGRNQVWEYQIAPPAMRCLAGEGGLGLDDGDGRAARFAYPAALALLQKTLYVVDAGSSALRSVQVDTGKVQTKVGHGLFEFGDQDGKRKAARLQHPCGLTVAGEPPHLWIADSYNAALKHLKLGGGSLGRADFAPALVRPTALCAGAGALWLADGDAPAVYRIDPATGDCQALPIVE
jgi:hypothetical protein